MRVLVTDGDNRAALAITRSLGKKGHEVFVGERSQPSLASKSRYSSGSFIYPDPSTDINGFIDSLLEKVRTENIDIVLPVSDITTMLVAEHMGSFEGRCIIPFPTPQALHLAASKDKLIELAANIGVPVPRTVVLSSPDEQYDVRGWGIDFPMVVKPHRSRIKTQNGRWISAGVCYAEDEEQLNSIFADKKQEYPLLIQQRVKGPGIGVFACYEKGRLKAVFSHRRLREKPPSGGVSVLRESIPVREDARQYAEALLDRLGWHGIAMVEFKLDESDGSLKLMEINGRFWGSLQLAIDAGVDFPSLLLDVAAGRDIPRCTEYKAGVKTRWFWGDVDALLMVLFKSRSNLHLPPGHKGRAGYLVEFLKSCVNGTRNEVLRLDDIRPWILETSRWFSRQIFSAADRH